MEHILAQIPFHYYDLVYGLLGVLGGISLRYGKSALILIEISLILVKMAQFYVKHHPQGKVMAAQTNLDDKLNAMSDKLEPEMPTLLSAKEAGGEG